MTPEMMFAQSLGSLPSNETEKLADALSSLSIEELESVLRDGGLEKTAVPGMVVKGIGGAMRWATGTPVGTRALQGAAVGAAGGVARHATSNDPNSSLVGNVVGGAALGAGAGWGAGAAARVSVP